MNLDEIRAVLDEALPMRSPVRDPDATARAHVAALEDHMLRTAQIGGSLVEALHWLRAAEARLTDQWEALQGWEVALKKRRVQATAADIKTAKKEVAPQLFETIREARSLRESVSDQIARLEKEGDRMSRAYTMVSGG